MTMTISMTMTMTMSMGRGRGRGSRNRLGLRLLYWICSLMFYFLQPLIHTAFEPKNGAEGIS